MKKILLLSSVIACCLLLPVLVHAQVGFDSTDVTDAPIDGGVSLLIIAGVGYGAKKLHGKRKSAAQKETVNREK